QGFLGTQGCKQAEAVGAVRPVRLEIALPEGATLTSGQPRTEIGHLEGRSNKLSMSYYGSSPTDNRGKAEWIVTAPAGGKVEVTAVSQRAGVLRRQVQLEAGA
ncbi:MAG: carboxypeptidase, partial [Anaerolineae bacterium]